MIGKFFTQKGWDVDVANPGRCFCPACVNQRREKPPVSEPPPSLKVVESVEHYKGTPTSDQRVRIRHLLDSHFDDKVGRYLDDWTDQKIASSIGLPWKAVEQIRIAGWGELREDPAILAIRTDYEACCALSTRYNEALARLKQKIDDLERRLGFKPA